MPNRGLTSIVYLGGVVCLDFFSFLVVVGGVVLLSKADYVLSYRTETIRVGVVCDGGMGTATVSIKNHAAVRGAEITVMTVFVLFYVIHFAKLVEKIRQDYDSVTDNAIRIIGIKDGDSNQVSTVVLSGVRCGEPTIVSSSVFREKGTEISHFGVEPHIISRIITSRRELYGSTHDVVFSVGADGDDKSLALI